MNMKTEQPISYPSPNGESNNKTLASRALDL